MRRLLAASRLPAAPAFSARMVGRPSPNGRSQAASITRAASATAIVPPAFNTAFVTAGVSSPLPESGPTHRNARGAAENLDERFGDPGGPDPGEATSSGANASRMRERAAQSLNPEMGRMGAEDPSTAFSVAPLGPPELSMPDVTRPSAPGPAKPRTVRIGGRDYPVILPSIRDARLHVAAALLTLQVLGQTVLGFRLSVAQILVCLAVGALIEFGVAFFKDHMLLWPASGLLTGNSTAFILRVPGTLHGQWWSLHGIEIFIGVVAISMASKYLIRWRGRHIFNPSNVALVAAFVVLGPTRTEPLDLWWIPIGPWMIVTYAILIGGGVFIGWRLGLLGMEVAFMASFAIFVALALAPVPDHCM